MLVLTRQPGQSIVLGGGIVIEVIEVTRGNNVRLGITAPKTVPIVRKELLAQASAEASQNKNES